MGRWRSRLGRLGGRRGWGACMTSQLGVTGDVAWRSRGDGEVGEDDGLDGGEDLEKLEKWRRARGIRWGPVKAPAPDRGCLSLDAGGGKPLAPVAEPVVHAMSIKRAVHG